MQLRGSPAERELKEKIRAKKKSITAVVLIMMIVLAKTMLPDHYSENSSKQGNLSYPIGDQNNYGFSSAL